MPLCPVFRPSATRILKSEDTGKQFDLNATSIYLMWKLIQINPNQSKILCIFKGLPGKTAAGKAGVLPIGDEIHQEMFHHLAVQSVFSILLLSLLSFNRFNHILIRYGQVSQVSQVVFINVREVPPMGWCSQCSPHPRGQELERQRPCIAWWMTPMTPRKRSSGSMDHPNCLDWWQHQFGWPANFCSNKPQSGLQVKQRCKTTW